MDYDKIKLLINRIKDDADYLQKEFLTDNYLCSKCLISIETAVKLLQENE